MALFWDGWSLDLLVLCISTCALIYWFVNRKYTYWERRGFKSLQNPVFLLGHLKSTFTQKMFIGEFIARVHKNVDEPFIGFYGFLWPFLLVRDSQLIRNILIKDFQYFTDRKYKRFCVGPRHSFQFANIDLLCIVFRRCSL